MHVIQLEGRDWTATALQTTLQVRVSSLELQLHWARCLQQPSMTWILAVAAWTDHAGLWSEYLELLDRVERWEL